MEDIFFSSELMSDKCKQPRNSTFYSLQHLICNFSYHFMLLNTVTVSTHLFRRQRRTFFLWYWYWYKTKASSSSFDILITNNKYITVNNKIYLTVCFVDWTLVFAPNRPRLCFYEATLRGQRVLRMLEQFFALLERGMKILTSIIFLRTSSKYCYQLRLRLKI